MDFKSGSMDTLAVRELLLALPLLTETFSTEGPDSVSKIKNIQNDEPYNLYLDAVLLDLMGSYWCISNQFERQGDN